ncbi:MAG: hypothetical protein CMM02_20805 [Rhodopirellula sp.]|nr:hypothetical protein [Rhodopirellula sp.]|tara:strand:+ start:295 stop:483 length:189 start_codon:yes stop_codon:yes gene_type:complete
MVLDDKTVNKILGVMKGGGNINDLKKKSLKELREYANKKKIKIRDNNGKLLNKNELIKKIKR